MDRRTLLKGVAATAAITSNPHLAVASSVNRPNTKAPNTRVWSELDRQVGGRLIKIQSPLEVCAEANGIGSQALFRDLKNPYYLGDEPGLTQTLGWIDAWTSRASSYAVAAEKPEDISAAIDFTRAHRLRLVVKGGGHSYFGNSNAAGSLLVWTRRMRKIELHDDFVGLDCPANEKPVSAVSIGAGALWGQVYNAVVSKGGRYVQGGGCMTVGVAGFVQGGGFGSFSKAFGTGASNLLEAEIVTADGKVRIVNAVRDPDLFFSLKGGGGGTFGVVTRLTLQTHDLPSTIGAILFSVKAQSDAAWRKLVARMISFYAEALHNPTWGEQMGFTPSRKLRVSMLMHGLQKEEVEAVWKPFLSWIAERPEDYKMEGEPFILAAPARSFWDPAFLRTLPGVTLPDDRPGASSDSLFWATNQGEAGQVLNAFQSMWLPEKLLEPQAQAGLVDALVEASAQWSVSLHTNKGLAGGTPEAIARSRNTATNPEVLDAFALLICAAEADPAWPGIPGHEPDVAEGRREAAAVVRAMAPMRKLVPSAGSYMSEADYFGKDWKSAYWGTNYARLAAAKRRYDSKGVFIGHHCVENT